MAHAQRCAGRWPSRELLQAERAWLRSSMELASLIEEQLADELGEPPPGAGDRVAAGIRMLVRRAAGHTVT